MGKRGFVFLFQPGSEGQSLCLKPTSRWHDKLNQRGGAKTYKKLKVDLPTRF